MNASQHLSDKPINWIHVRNRLLLGATLGIAVCLFFILGIDRPNPDWPKLWQIRPLVVLPVAGACGGAFWAFMDHVTPRNGWKKIAGTVLSVLVLLIGLWMGTVAGLDGTMWD